MDDYEHGEELYLQFGVMLKKASACHISEISTTGILHFLKCKNTNKYFLEWRPNESCEITDTDSPECGWAIVDTIERTSPLPFSSLSETKSVAQKRKNVLRAKTEDLRGLEMHRNELRLLNKDSTVHSSYLFLHSSSSVQSFTDYLVRTGILRRYASGKYVFISQDENDEKLQKSFSELNIEDIRNSPRYTKTKTIWDNPYADIFTKLANVPNHVFPKREENRPRNLDIYVDEEEVKPEEILSPVLSPRPSIVRGDALDSITWKEFQKEDGSIPEADKVKEIIFNGGIEESIRPQVWKYLLNYDIWENTTEERIKRRAAKTQEYYKMKLQWFTMSAKQEQNFCDYRDRKCQLEKDVKRTDRTCDFFAGDDNPNLEKLQDILMTYIMYDFDLGYVQGMSDLLAPILTLLEDEVESFWCFVGFMEKVFTNFDIDQKGMKNQFENLKVLMAFTNEKFYNYLKDNQSENMFFCFRWLLVWFKREFSNSDILNLWEVLFTGLPCPNFQLFICLAILDGESNKLIDEHSTFNEILKHVNELTGNIDLKTALEKAEAIYLQIKNTKQLSDEIKLIIGEEVNNESVVSDEESIDEMKEIAVVEKSSEEIERLQRKLDEACDMSLSYMFF